MGRQALMKKQALRRKASKAGIKGRKAQEAWAKKQVDKSGSTWVNRSGKIIQADEGRNRGRKFKEKVGQNVGNVRDRQKARENIRKGNVKGLANQAGGTLNKSFNWLKKNVLKINKKKK